MPGHGKISAGLLLWRMRAGVPEVLLVHPGGPFFQNRNEASWSVPKGETEHPGEDLLERARVEFQEELGVPPPAGPLLPLGSVVQKGGKTVHAWGCEGDFTGPPRSNTFTCEWPPHSGRLQEYPEVDRAEWFDLDAARAKINPAQVAFLERLWESLRSRE